MYSYGEYSHLSRKRSVKFKIDNDLDQTTTDRPLQRVFLYRPQPQLHREMMFLCRVPFHVLREKEKIRRILRVTDRALLHLHRLPPVDLILLYLSLKIVVGIRQRILRILGIIVGVRELHWAIFWK
jgi:hypothetical protein